MAANVDDKSDVGEPNQFEDDQKNGLLPSEKKESDLNAPEKKEEGDFDNSKPPSSKNPPCASEGMFYISN